MPHDVTSLLETCGDPFLLFLNPQFPESLQIKPILFRLLNTGKVLKY